MGNDIMRQIIDHDTVTFTIYNFYNSLKSTSGDGWSWWDDDGWSWDGWLLSLLSFPYEKEGKNILGN